MTKQAKQTEAQVAPDPFAAIRSQANARPEQVASALGISGKLVRGYLRSTFARPVEAKGTTWVLTNEQTNATIDHFLARRSPVTPTATEATPES